MTFRAEKAAFRHGQTLKKTLNAILHHHPPVFFISSSACSLHFLGNVWETYLLRGVEQMSAAENEGEERGKSAERQRNAQLCVGFVRAVLSYGIITYLLYSDTNEWSLLLLLIAEFLINY